MALEFADLIYYMLQENYQINSSDDFFITLYLGDAGWDLGAKFCIVKYKTRLEFGDNPNYKAIEAHVMAEYLMVLKNTRPDLALVLADQRADYVF
jgi:hypothetical protein